MTQENVALTLQAYDAFNRRDLDAFLALMDPEVEAWPRQAAMEGSHRGHAGIRRWYEDLLDVFPDLRMKVIDVRDLGDVIVAMVRMHGHGADSASPVDETVWIVHRLRDGRGIQWRVCGSEAEALEAG